MIKRRYLTQQTVDALKRARIVALIGPRQCGKTTLAREIAGTRQAHYFDLENPRDIARLENPQLSLEPLKGLVVVDEAQQKPDLFPLLRVLSDRVPLPARFLILGSASPDLIKNCSETLAGRIEFVDMAGFTLDEMGDKAMTSLWLRGGFPGSILAKTDKDSLIWRQQFIRTFLQRDPPQLGINLPTEQLRRFWTMLAHYHGQTWNSSEIAASLGVAHTTTRRWLDVLTGALMIRQLPPWFENVGKRTVKAPKIYLRDSGLLHALLSIDNLPALTSHPKLGASWEGFALDQVLRMLSAETEAYFWSTYSGAEVDLLLLRKGKRVGLEFKYADAPGTTKSMHLTLAALKLDRLYIVYPGSRSYPLTNVIEAIPLTAVVDEIK